MDPNNHDRSNCDWCAVCCSAHSFRIELLICFAHNHTQSPTHSAHKSDKPSLLSHLFIHSSNQQTEASVRTEEEPSATLLLAFRLSPCLILFLSFPSILHKSPSFPPLPVLFYCSPILFLSPSFIISDVPIPYRIGDPLHYFNIFSEMLRR